MAIRHWPEGRICSGCFAKACETYGICDSCGTDRLLPGIGPAGQRWCTDCAGGIGNFTCTRCGQEGWQHDLGVCGRCVLGRPAQPPLDDGTGQIRRELRPLHDRIVGMDRPRSGILWLSKPHVPPILRALAHHQVPLTHQGIATLTPWRSVIHVRDLLVAAGILPPVDRFLFLFEQWLPGWLDSVPDREHRKILHHYATWHLLRRLRATAAAGPIGHYRHQSARRDLRVTAGFLTDLAHQDLTLAGCRQADLDRWMAHATTHDKTSLRPFLRWAINSRWMPRLQLPPTNQPPPSPISHQQRLELIRRLHNDDALDPTERVIGLLILLYAQSLNKITRLTIDDITIARRTDADPTRRPPSTRAGPVRPDHHRLPGDPTEPDHRDQPGSRWLFPGRRAGQPMHPTTIRMRLQRPGIPNLNGRSRALRDMLLQAPPAVVAGMLGYAAGRAEAIAAEAGATWQHYAAGDHSRQPGRART